MKGKDLLMQKRNFILLLMIWMIVFVISAFSVNAEEQPIDVFSLPVGFVPNVQFAPLYAALENGYFSEEHIDLSLNHSMEIDTVALVGAGEIPFGICSGEQVLLGRNKGLPLVYIAGWYQQYPVGIVSLAEKNIRTMEDLRGKKVGTPVLSGASYIGLEALLQQAGMTDADLQLETIGYAQVEMLTSDKVDAAVIYVSNEPEQLKALGYDIHLITVADSMSMVGNGLITNEKMIREHPDLVSRMTRAFLKGIQWTKEHPDEAYDICLKYVDNLKDAKNQDLQKQVLKQTIRLYENPEQTIPGASDPEAWQNMAAVMSRMGLIKADIDVAAAFSNAFVK
jgi:NitT/TauT family transport system substrate-binding protein